MAIERLPRLVAPALALLAFPALAAAGEVIPPGPILAEVVSVYDGDTLTVDAHPWPGVTIRTSVRVSGIDAPEIRGKCDAEKEMAREARDLARNIVGARVTLLDVEFGKYAGRVVADVFAEDGRKLAGMLIGAGLGRPYDGGAWLGWCG